VVECSYLQSELKGGTESEIRITLKEVYNMYLLLIICCYRNRMCSSYYVLNANRLSKKYLQRKKNKPFDHHCCSPYHSITLVTLYSNSPHGFYFAAVLLITHCTQLFIPIVRIRIVSQCCRVMFVSIRFPSYHQIELNDWCTSLHLTNI
jgi:hypothetical protein